VDDVTTTGATLNELPVGAVYVKEKDAEYVKGLDGLKFLEVEW